MQDMEKKTQVVEEINQFVTFQIGKEIYGIDVVRAKEVLNLTEITHVPNSSSFIKGVIDLRGTIVPLLDMRLKFGIEEKEYDENTAVVIVEFNKKLFGMIVDTVLDVLSMSTEKVENTEHFKNESNGDLVKGIGRVDNNLIIVLDVDEIISSDEIELTM